ncbi:dTDP-4-dehydrorhamnose reductase [Paenibacillus timonensis]|uniref:dTDP-4-dehydrorhamnose reductase n=1 Tax=Paenibacillus timonensis TaxID=225915 RepID=A0ABW3SG38_9BACL|nr:dTDP-4-dehydrorhamnose reductase [Paenibacillus timonensis]MCH1642333.1 dTDP-4-dehydrorhamnose reductase [Paenibacillus timonensis]
MKVLVTGAKGQLGFDVVRCLKELGVKCIGVGMDDLDISNLEATAKYIRCYHPDVVVHCAAYTDVDRAEFEAEKCRIINVTSTENIASLCNEIGAKMVYISTDYVFSGEGDTPFEVFSKVGPLSVYGQTKLDGEKVVQKSLPQHFIVRTSWAFGVNGDNFVKKMLRISGEYETINVVSDQIGSPTFTFDLAQLIVDMIQTEKFGVYHATNEGYCSRAEFAAEIFRLTDKKNKVNFIKSDQYHMQAVRPKNSRLSKSSLDLGGFNRLPSWKEALVRYLKETSAK